MNKRLFCVVLGIALVIPCVSHAALIFGTNDVQPVNSASATDPAPIGIGPFNTPVTPGAGTEAALYVDYSISDNRAAYEFALPDDASLTIQKAELYLYIIDSFTPADSDGFRIYAYSNLANADGSMVSADFHNNNLGSQLGATQYGTDGASFASNMQPLDVTGYIQYLYANDKSYAGFLLAQGPAGGGPWYFAAHTNIDPSEDVKLVITAVPIPSAVWLLGSGLLVVAFRRRLKE